VSTQATSKDQRDLNAAQREKLAIELRMQGYDFDAIAQSCGYANRSAAYKAWKRALAKIPAPAVVETRKRMVQAYDVARKGLWFQFAAGDPDAIDAWVKLDKSERELFGLDTPKDTQQQTAQLPVIREYPSGTASEV
jgi:hypothetical protein